MSVLPPKADKNRVATAGEMTASIAHEIRQPLAAIMANGQAALRWLQRQVPDIEEAMSAVQGVIQDSARANAVDRSWRTNNVRFAPESRHVQCKRLCPLWAKSGHPRKCPPSRQQV